MDKLKRMPIFFPIIGIIALIYNLFYIFPLYLFGRWRCDDCYKRFSMDDEKISTQHGDICSTCYKEQYGVMDS